MPFERDRMPFGAAMVTLAVFAAVAGTAAVLVARLVTQVIEGIGFGGF